MTQLDRPAGLLISASRGVTYKPEGVMFDKLLEVQNLQTHSFTRAGVVKAVEEVSFDLEPSETLGIVGESGCGKSVTALSIMRLVDRPGKIVGGKLLYKGDDILDM